MDESTVRLDKPAVWGSVGRDKTDLRFSPRVYRRKIKGAGIGSRVGRAGRSRGPNARMHCVTGRQRIVFQLD